ncbi:ATP-binding protein [Tumebacillus sp. ITR2]|uniref:ATP-binding protein n=1 Tax=Tumebacillus amylolyticus TaxID=2801339 RepID=A0ABS1JEI9_9BACL|nr:ATP-binding protein [Tumebacillus amylolyticus]MBL0388717.1 ATP-binding protein [Tumebacillus amylolyticus]
MGLRIKSEDDIYMALSQVRRLMKQVGFSELNQQKVLVTVSELTRNVLDHAGANGQFFCEAVEGRGVRVKVTDNGPGISNLSRALEGEKSPESQGLGLGLSGVKRLMDACTIETSTGGTSIIATKWNS